MSFVRLLNIFSFMIIIILANYPTESLSNHDGGSDLMINVTAMDIDDVNRDIVCCR